MAIGSLVMLWAGRQASDDKLWITHRGQMHKVTSVQPPFFYKARRHQLMRFMEVASYPGEQRYGINSRWAPRRKFPSDQEEKQRTNKK